MYHHEHGIIMIFDYISRCLLSILENFNFLATNEVKGTKMAQNEQKACPHSIKGTTNDQFMIFKVLKTVCE